MLSLYAKQQMFLGAVARQNFVAPTRPNKLFWLNQVQKNISAQDYVQKKNYCWSVLCLFWWHQRTNEDFLWYRQTSFGEISTFCHKKDLWTQNNNFQTCCKIRLGYFCRQMKVKKKKFEFKQMQLKATLLFKQCRPKLNKRCFRRVGAAKFFRANAPQTRLFESWKKVLHVFFLTPVGQVGCMVESSSKSLIQTAHHLKKVQTFPFQTQHILWAKKS